MGSFLLRAVAGATFIALCGLPHAAAASVRFDPQTRMFRLDGGQVTYAFGINEAEQLQAMHWGGRLADGDRLGPLKSLPGHASFDLSASVTPQEFPAQGGGIYSEVALKVAYADGNRDTVLHYVSHEIKGETVAVRMKDISLPLQVTLHYSIDPDTGVVGRSASIENLGTTPLRIDQAASASYTLAPQSDYRLHHLTGRWAGEWTLQQRPVTEGASVLESRRGSTGQQNTPWFAIDRDGLSSEESGPVWF
ncbi:MAG: glycoside hydrolase family 36 N-terminal domain-containing protein, partial [Lysobacter sp.]